jgi:predicted GNAT family N-acyltransferase
MRIAMSAHPSSEPFRVRRVDWTHERGKLRAVRIEVFVREQAVSESLEWDGRDQAAVHVLAEDDAGRPVGTARLLPSGQIGRMAVLPAWRGRGVGKALLRELLRIASADDFPLPFLNAQTSALPFYRRAGFVPVGEEFQEAGIPHRRMVLQVPPDAAVD